MRPPTRPLRALPFRIALTGAWALLALPAVEIGYRLHTHKPALTLDNWRAGRVEDMTFGDRMRFDPELGWVPWAGFASRDYSTLAHGIRRNRGEAEIRTGAILAVGGTFTSGPDVGDEQTWPAHLERLLDTPVLNAGVPGYAADQTVLRAERLLAVVRPRTLVVGLSEESIARARLSSYGTAKPYYTVGASGLVYHAPRPPWKAPPSQAGWDTAAREALGHSALLDAALAQAAPSYWLGAAGELVMRSVDTDPVAVTCGLLERLETRADAAGAQVLVLMQHARTTVAERNRPGESASKVAVCARAAGLTVVDQFAALRALAAASPGALDDLYLQDDEGDGFGHMTDKGNRQAAELLAGVLAKRKLGNKE